MYRHLTVICTLSIFVFSFAFGTHAKRTFYTMQSSAIIEIPVYFHVIRDTNGDGNVAESKLDEQINVLNSAFNGATVGANVQFFFRKAGVTQTYNHDWFIMELQSIAENEAKRTLRQGGANALNFYTTRGGTPPPGSPYPYGWAWLPSEYASNPCRDGVVVPFTTLPGVDSNSNNPFNKGDLPVHEVGHWLGLYHTYHDPLERNDCAYVNDEVADTPVHLDSSLGQCIQEDTCPAPGVDPIHNFMTNTSDACKYEFTRGQFERMAAQYMLYRQSTTPPECPLPAYEGWAEIAECSWITGWAADRDRPNTSINVSIYDGDTRVITILASDSRSDVGAYLGDNGLHGFAIPTPARFKDGLQHTLRVKFESSTTDLSSSPKTLTCAPQATYYEIVARHSGKCLDVEGESMAAGARVIQFVCGGWANQQWQVIPVGGGYYKIVARHSGKVLDVQGAGLDNGTPVWQWDENGTPAQHWEIVDVGGGYRRIMARHSGKALDVAGGSTADLTQIHQWDYVGIANQQWELRPVQ